MKKFKVKLVESPSYRDRSDTVLADSWYIDESGALVFIREEGKMLRESERSHAYGPRAWESVEYIS